MKWLIFQRFKTKKLNPEEKVRNVPTSRGSPIIKTN